MLTADLAIFEYKDSCRIPDRLKSTVHRDYVDRALRAIELYGNSIGKRRHEIHDAVDAMFDDDEHYHAKRGQALCRLLDKKSVFKESARGASLKLRTEVFSQAAAMYPLVEKLGGLFGTARSEVATDIANRLERPWSLAPFRDCRLLDKKIPESKKADLGTLHCQSNRSGSLGVECRQHGRVWLSRYPVRKKAEALFCFRGRFEALRPSSLHTDKIDSLFGKSQVADFQQ